MSIRHDYNPSALQRIRNGACARDLGWDEKFYRNVCQKHGLEATTSSCEVKAEAAASHVEIPVLKSPKPSISPEMRDYRPRARKPASDLSKRRQFGFGVPDWMYDAIDLVTKASRDTFVRDAIIAGGNVRGPLLDWRRGGGASWAINTTLSDSEKDAAFACANERAMPIGEFCRRALVYALGNAVSP